MERTIISAAVAIILILSTHISRAQLNCDDLKKENEYLKKALQITTPTKTVTSSKIDFNFIKCEGNIKEQTVDVILTLVNHDANQRFQFSKAAAIDMEANQYKTYNISIGNSGVSNTIYTDTPIKTIIKFKKVLPSVKMLKLIPISYFYDRPGNEVEIEFKDIVIDWK